MDNTRKEQNLFTEEDFDIFNEMIDAVSTQEEIVEENQDKNLVEEDVDDELIRTLSSEEEDEDEADGEGEGDDESDNDDEAENDDEDSSLFTPYAKLLVDNDILSTLDLETFDGTAEGLKRAMFDEVSYHVNKYKEELPATVKRLVDGYEAGIPFDEMLKISSDRIRYDNINETTLADNVDLQKTIVADYLKKTTKFNDVRINRMIDSFENNAELEEESKVSLLELRQLQDVEEQNALLVSKNEQAEFEKRNAAIMNQLKEHINTTNEIIPGIKVNKIMKDKITRNLTVPVAYDDQNVPINKVGLYSRQHPIEFEVVLNYIFEATNEFKDWGILGKSGKTKAIRELENVARNLDTVDKGTRKQITKENDINGLLGAISKELYNK